MTTARMRRRSINIDWNDGKKRVEARVCGRLAVHAYPGFDDHWRLSHVPTGLALRPSFRTEAEALAALHRVLPLANWDFTDETAPKRWPKRRMQRIAKALNCTLQKTKTGWRLEAVEP